MTKTRKVTLLIAGLTLLGIGTLVINLIGPLTVGLPGTVTFLLGLMFGAGPVIAGVLLTVASLLTLLSRENTSKD